MNEEDNKDPGPDDSNNNSSSGNNSESGAATENVGTSSDEDSDPTDVFSSPEHSPIPYSPPPLKSYAFDIDWNKYEKMPSKRVEDRLRKEAGKLSCVGHPSLATNLEIKKVMKYYAQEAMADMPNIFGGPQAATTTKIDPKVSKDAPLTTERHVKGRKYVGKKPRVEHVTENTPIAKKQPIVATMKPASSRVFNSFDNIGDSFISEAGYKIWMAKSREKKHALATRASPELFMFNTEQSKEIQTNVARIKDLEDEVAKLKLDVKNANSKVTKLEPEKKRAESTISTLKDDLVW